MGIPDVTERKGYEPARVRFSCGHATLEYTESRGRGNEVDYFLKVETLWAADKRIAQEVRIPLTAEQYHSLKEQYENPTEKVPVEQKPVEEKSEVPKETPK